VILELCEPDDLSAIEMKKLQVSRANQSEIPKRQSTLRGDDLLDRKRERSVLSFPR